MGNKKAIKRNLSRASNKKVLPEFQQNSNGGLFSLSRKLMLLPLFFNSRDIGHR